MVFMIFSRQRVTQSTNRLRISGAYVARGEEYLGKTSEKIDVNFKEFLSRMQINRLKCLEQGK